MRTPARLGALAQGHDPAALAEEKRRAREKAERTRMARDLHDTLLQTIQGSKMVADDVLRRPEDAAGLQRAMEQVSSWLGQASAEGRAAVSALRASTTETNDLAGVVMVRTPAHPQPQRQRPLKMVLVDRTGGPSPGGNLHSFCDDESVTDQY